VSCMLGRQLGCSAAGPACLGDRPAGLALQMFGSRMCICLYGCASSSAACVSLGVLCPCMLVAAGAVVDRAGGWGWGRGQHVPRQRAHSFDGGACDSHVCRVWGGGAPRNTTKTTGVVPSGTPPYNSKLEIAVAELPPFGFGCGHSSYLVRTPTQVVYRGRARFGLQMVCSGQVVVCERPQVAREAQALHKADCGAVCAELVKVGSRLDRSSTGYRRPTVL
jgi:hypothetical protein